LHRTAFFCLGKGFAHFFALQKKAKQPRQKNGLCPGGKAEGLLRSAEALPRRCEAAQAKKSGAVRRGKAFRTAKGGGLRLRLGPFFCFAKKSGAEQIGAMPPAAEAKPSVLD
jgi:hypothetical protein